MLAELTAAAAATTVGPAETELRDIELRHATLAEGLSAVVRAMEPIGPPLATTLIEDPSMEAGPGITLSGSMSFPEAMDRITTLMHASWHLESGELLVEHRGAPTWAFPPAAGGSPELDSYLALEQGDAERRSAALLAILDGEQPAVITVAGIRFLNDLRRFVPGAADGSILGRGMQESLLEHAGPPLISRRTRIDPLAHMPGSADLAAAVLRVLAEAPSPRTADRMVLALALAGLMRLQGAAPRAWEEMTDPRLRPGFPAQVLGMISPPGRLEDLRQMLRQGDARQRLQAITALRGYGSPQAMDALIRHWDEPGQEADHLALVQAYGEAEDPRTTQLLILAELDATLRRPALEALSISALPGASAAVLAALAGPLPEDERRILTANLRLEPIPEGVAAVLRLTDQDAPAPVRWSGTVLLGTFHGEQGERSACEALLALLDDQDPAICIEAITSLGSLGDAAAIPALERILRLDADSSCSLEAGLSLDRFCSAAAHQALGAAWCEVQRHAVDGGRQPSEGLLLAVGLLHQPDFVQAMMEDATRMPGRRLASMLALAETRDSQSLDWLLEASADGGTDAQWPALIAIGTAACDMHPEALARIRSWPGSLAAVVDAALSDRLLRGPGAMQRLLTRGLVVVIAAGLERDTERPRILAALASALRQHAVDDPPLLQAIYLACMSMGPERMRSFAATFPDTGARSFSRVLARSLADLADPMHMAMLWLPYGGQSFLADRDPSL